MAGGRKSDLEKMPPEVRSNLLAALERGIPDVDVITWLGIGETTFYRWLRLGEEHHGQVEDPDHERVEHSVYSLFWEDVTRARAALPVMGVEQLLKADPKAIQWVLARRRPDLFAAPGRRIQLEAERELHRLRVEKAQVELDIAKAKAELFKKGGDRLLLPFDLLDDPDLSDTEREVLAGIIERRGLTALVSKTLAGDDISLEDLAKAIGRDPETLTDKRSPS